MLKLVLLSAWGVYMSYGSSWWRGKLRDMTGFPRGAIPGRHQTFEHWRDQNIVATRVGSVLGAVCLLACAARCVHIVIVAL